MDPRLGRLTQLVTNAPWWVWVLLAVLLVMGLWARRSRTMPLRRFAALPAVFLVWGLISLASVASTRPELAGAWALTAVFGAVLGWVATPLGIQGDREQRRIYVPGSSWPLVVSLLVFVVKYSCGVIMAIQPESRPLISLIDMAASGASSGFFASRFVHGLLRYRQGSGISADGGVPAL